MCVCVCVCVCVYGKHGAKTHKERERETKVQSVSARENPGTPLAGNHSRSTTGSYYRVINIIFLPALGVLKNGKIHPVDFRSQDIRSPSG